MNLIPKVYHSLTGKKSNKHSSALIGMKELEYVKLKKEIKQVLKRINPVLEYVILDALNKELLQGIVFSPTVKSFSKELQNKASEISEVSEKLETYYEEEGSIVSQHNNLDKGEATITAVAFAEPRSAEEIIKLLKIDISVWRLSQYWNKEKMGRWYVSALVSKINKQSATEKPISFLDSLLSHPIPQIPYKKSELLSLITKSSKDTSCGVLAIQDLHFGKVGNLDIDEILWNCVTDLIKQSTPTKHFEEILFVVGGDALNMDTWANTTTSGTPMEGGGEGVTDTYLKAYNSYARVLQFLSGCCEKLRVVFVPGNHDRLSSFHITHALQVSMSSWKNIEFVSEYSERKVITYGKNFFGFEHGDVSKATTPLTYATEFPKQWGETYYRTLYTGHLHTKRTKIFVTENELNGFIIKIVASLSSTDYYHYHNKWTGNIRSGSLDVYEREKGKTAEFIFNL